MTHKTHTEDCLDANDDTSVLKGKCICPKQLTEEEFQEMGLALEEIRRGELLAHVLGIRRALTDADGTRRYQTTWGTKTALGLFRTVKRIIEEGK